VQWRSKLRTWKETLWDLIEQRRITYARPPGPFSITIISKVLLTNEKYLRRQLGVIVCAMDLVVGSLGHEQQVTGVQGYCIVCP